MIASLAVSVVVEVSARKFEIPPVCACCGEAPQAEVRATFTRRTGVRVIREDTRGFGFPYCQHCLDHVARWARAGARGNIGFVVLGALGIVMLAMVQAVVGVGLFVIALIIRLTSARVARTNVRSRLRPSCACPDTAVAFRGWSGTVSSFAFASPAYAARFALGNREKLVNVSGELRQLLEQGAIPRMQVVARSAPAVAIPAPRSGPAIAPPAIADHRVLDWIAKIEDFKGAEARHNALHRALAEIIEPAARHELLTAAGRIEVSAVLDKIDGLSTNAAKRRHLQKAIEDMQVSELPPELQAHHIRQLEARLREL